MYIKKELLKDKPNRIKLLPNSVKKQIAAGEVIDGPYSVVKELIENSIDAGADNIEVKIEDAGLKSITVIDNGTGILKDDIKLTIEEHATSKIEKVDDIFNILSLGFRGEALSSIASVSKLTIYSRHILEQTGAKLIYNEKSKEIYDWEGPSGTTVIVENLFYNTPARKKFLKSKISEANNIKNTIFMFAIAYPQIKFKYTIDNKKTIVIDNPDRLERIKHIYGKDMASNLLYCELNDLEVKISGYLSNYLYYRSNKNLQKLFVNGRLVNYPFLNYILRQSYPVLKKGQYPLCFAFMEINPKIIDVNVHPSKREIRFYDTKYINSIISNFIKKGINTIQKVPNQNILSPDNDEISEKLKLTTNEFENKENNSSGNKETELKDKNINVNNFHNFMYNYEQHSNNKINTNNELNFTNLHKQIIKESKRLYELSNKQYEYYGILFGTYILFSIENEFMIVDFHAAHERILFDKIMNRLNAQKDAQMLLVPVVIELTYENYDAILENLEFINNQFGINIEPFGDNSVIVNSIPDYLNDEDLEIIIKDISNIIIENDTSQILTIKKKIAEKIACHSALRSNDNLNYMDVENIINFVLNTDEYNCPHGRPFVYKLSKNEIERLFKRI